MTVIVLAAVPHDVRRNAVYPLPIDSHQPHCLVLSRWVDPERSGSGVSIAEKQISFLRPMQQKARLSCVVNAELQSSSATDMDHAAGWLEKSRFADMMAGLLQLDDPSNPVTQFIVICAAIH